MSYTRSAYSDFAGGSVDAHKEISDEKFIMGILEFEAALTAAALAEGVITEGAAKAALASIDAFEVDVVAIAEASAAGGNPTIPIVKALKKAAGETSGVHFGATSQDAIDTSLALCFKRGGSKLLNDVDQVIDLLRGLVSAHKDTPVMARTLGQQALPTTFGAIAGGWLEGVASAAAALNAELEALPVQYAGGAGTLVDSEGKGLLIHNRLAENLGLAATPVVWHSNRQPFVAVALSSARLAGAVRKIAGDIIVHSATEVHELREATPGGSSAMPHKANPAAAVACDGYARRTPAMAATMLDSLDCRNQRGVGSWHAEWQTLRDLFAATASAISRIHASLDGIVVDTESMANNINTSTGVGEAPRIAENALTWSAAHMKGTTDV